MRINVTQEHIDRAIKAKDSPGYGVYPNLRSMTCPVAKAVNEMFGIKDASVNGVNVKIMNAIVPLPEWVWSQITAFDLGQEIFPFSFDL